MVGASVRKTVLSILCQLNQFFVSYKIEIAPNFEFILSALPILRCPVDNTLRIHPVRQNSQDNFLFIDDHPVSISTENFKLFNRITKPPFSIVVDGICCTIYKIDRHYLKNTIR